MELLFELIMFGVTYDIFKLWLDSRWNSLSNFQSQNTRRLLIIYKIVLRLFERLSINQGCQK